MENKTVIKVERLSKRYRIGLREEMHDSLAASMAAFLKSPFKSFKKLKNLSSFGDESEDVFWALKDISFEVKQGDALGIIGMNGAGKSTLLKVLSRITEPTSGEISIKGRVASLLEVGTGFHADLTGRENIFLNGTILGMTRKEINQKMEEIIEFSGVRKFIDTPVKRYSSGMRVRLAFSVAAHLDPEILIIDEVLAVGDYEFQNKCIGKMQDVARGGKTILFVSHNMAAINQLCSRAILLKQGQKIADGTVSEIIEAYKNANISSTSDLGFVSFPSNNDIPFQLLELSFKNAQHETLNHFEYVESIFVSMRFKIKTVSPNYYINFTLLDINELNVFTTTDEDYTDGYSAGNLPVGEHTYNFTIPANTPLICFFATGFTLLYSSSKDY
ncbi:MAG: polysaccharide ABC transporter ATP-binding protein [Bacteroidetes bacterium]|nr:polysaccharide ABC transporter ATP-binding protein [Bacteroidota bacterium]